MSFVSTDKFMRQRCCTVFDNFPSSFYHSRADKQCAGLKCAQTASYKQKRTGL